VYIWCLYIMLLFVGVWLRCSRWCGVVRDGLGSCWVDVRERERAGVAVTRPREVLGSNLNKDTGCLDCGFS
jgi:hypothetical protein